jgi:hypothetical protein
MYGALFSAAVSTGRAGRVIGIQMRRLSRAPHGTKITITFPAIPNQQLDFKVLLGYDVLELHAQQALCLTHEEHNLPRRLRRWCTGPGTYHNFALHVHVLARAML